MGGWPGGSKRGTGDIRERILKTARLALHFGTATSTLQRYSTLFNSMARTRSKSNAEASTSISDPPASTHQVHNSSPLKSSNYPSTIYERSEEQLDIAASYTFPKSESASPQTVLGRAFDPPEARPTWSGGHARVSRLGAIKALEQLRKRLNAIDEHSRELREARHILIKREEALVKERDELVEFLKSVELAILSGSSAYPDRPAAVDEMDVEVDVVGDDDEVELERCSKRKAIAGKCLGILATYVY